ncbi:hypothetical protein Lalb_Chr10g0102941 [Lupinus albus]|uniref:Knottin, scorpion toxin n=1 Tax=Lupinus albus TaxID=3870 RepID=A0A6A4PXA5_LUPAL|nr:hypothetical protein Lalb_Chr10g0102941 [Lupinus albus]
MALLKFIFLAIVGVLLFSNGMGLQVCIGTCKQYPNCNTACKKQGYVVGSCFPELHYLCCCGKDPEE